MITTVTCMISRDIISLRSRDTLEKVGGVGIFWDNNIPYQIRSNLCLTNAVSECVYIEIDKEIFKRDKNIIIGVIYRPPNSDLDAFNSSISLLLSELMEENKHCYIIGDYNINLLNYENHQLTAEFIDQLNWNSFVFFDKQTNSSEKFDILFENQFGFRKLHSSYMALMVLTDKLIRSLENGEFVVVVYLDFYKAFDTVEHEILLSKLSHYGIRGNCLNWFQSYLSNRKQFVTYNGVSSPVNRITCGVPQGSILGPLLFLLYINDLGNICSSTTSILFADDTSIFKMGNNLKEMEDELNSEFSKFPFG